MFNQLLERIIKNSLVVHAIHSLMLLGSIVYENAVKIPMIAPSFIWLESSVKDVGKCNYS